MGPAVVGLTPGAAFALDDQILRTLAAVLEEVVMGPPHADVRPEPRAPRFDIATRSC